MTKKIRVYIDGENFRKGVTRVLLEQAVVRNSRDMKDYDLSGLLRDILETQNFSASYYASKIKLPNGYQPSGELKAHLATIKEYTRQWVPALIRQHIVYVKAGYLKVTPSKECRKCHSSQDILQEKGVDVRLASDMLQDAYTTPTDTLVVFSSDSDLAPAMKKIADHGKTVVYVCFADSVNRSMVATASQTLTISPAKVKEYYR